MTRLQKCKESRFVKSFFVLFVSALLWNFSDVTHPFAKALGRWELDLKYQYFPILTKPSDKIVFLDIDDTSLARVSLLEGKWPWDRNVWANSLELISIGKPKAIIFDILFTEKNQYNPESDLRLANLVKGMSNVSFAISIDSWTMSKSNRRPAATTTLLRPYSPLWENLNHMHSVNSQPDNDGIFRSTPMYVESAGSRYSSLALNSVSLFLGHPEIQITPSKILLSTTDGKAYHIPVDESGRFHFHFYSKKFATIPFEEIRKLGKQAIESKADSSQLSNYLQQKFKDKIVLIGGSAAGLQDLKKTPINPTYPGALLHAVAISNILESHFLHQSSSKNQILITIGLMTLFYFILIFSKNNLHKTMIPAMALIAYFGLSIYLFIFEAIELPLFMPILFCLLAFLDWILYSLYLEVRLKAVPNAL